MAEQWNHKIFTVDNARFDLLAIDIFRFQSQNCTVYKDYLEALNIDPDSIHSIGQIPFLPVRFYKTHSVQVNSMAPATIFESSGTTESIHSRHLVNDLFVYENSFIKAFELFFGSVKNWCILGLLPSYLERKSSSLVYMVEKLVQLSGHPESGFYLDEYEKLFAILKELESKKQKTLLLGVTFALLDFAEKYSLPMQHTIVMETGGMKGRKKEMIREEVHAQLKNSFSLTQIYSEYGMTELLSQAYSVGEGVFQCPPWMKILIRDDEDPFMIKYKGAGIINVIDLANIYSCSFLATDDAGKLYPDGSFEVLGRVDGSDLRGCSLMVV